MNTEKRGIMLRNFGTFLWALQIKSNYNYVCAICFLRIILFICSAEKASMFSFFSYNKVAMSQENITWLMGAPTLMGIGAFCERHQWVLRAGFGRFSHTEKQKCLLEKTNIMNNAPFF
jgi:hypothetical protein